MKFSSHAQRKAVMLKLAQRRIRHRIIIIPKRDYEMFKGFPEEAIIKNNPDITWKPTQDTELEQERMKLAVKKFLVNNKYSSTKFRVEHQVREFDTGKLLVSPRIKPKYMRNEP